MVRLGDLVLLGLPSSVHTRPTVTDPMGRLRCLSLRHFGDEQESSLLRQSHTHMRELDGEHFKGVEVADVSELFRLPPLREDPATCQCSPTGALSSSSAAPWSELGGLLPGKLSKSLSSFSESQLSFVSSLLLLLLASMEKHC